MADYSLDYQIRYDSERNSCGILFKCFDTPNSVTVFGLSKPDVVEPLLLRVRNACLDFHRLWSFSSAESDISRINGQVDRVEVDQSTADLLREMIAFNHQTVTPTFKPDESKSLQDWADEIHTTLTNIFPQVKDEDEVAESFLSGGVDSSYVLAMSDAKRADSCGYDEERFDESLGILFDLVRSPYFTPETVAKEQGIIGQEIKMYDDSPEWRVNINLMQAMYSEHSINKDIAGTVETIAQITPEILYDCYNSYYNLNNMVLCVAGNITPEQVLAVADSKLTKDEPSVTESLMPEEPYKVKQDYIEQTLPVAVPLFSLGYKEDGGSGYVTSKESLCTAILLEAFAGEGSELYRELLDKKLINSSFAAEYIDGTGYRYISFSGESREPKLAAEIIKKAVVELHEKGISEEDFENARNCTYGRIARSWDSPSAIATDLINSQFTGREIFEPINLISGLTVNDVNERLRSELDPENFCLSVIKGIEAAVEDKSI